VKYPFNSFTVSLMTPSSPELSVVRPTVELITWCL